MSKTFSDDILKKAESVAELVISKQLDYGKKNILNTVIDPKLAIAVRLQDKIARMANLVTTENPKNESLEDTAKDIAGYGLILWMLLDGTFELPMTEDEVVYTCPVCQTKQLFGGEVHHEPDCPEATDGR